LSPFEKKSPLSKSEADEMSLFEQFGGKDKTKQLVDNWWEKKKPIAKSLSTTPERYDDPEEVEKIKASTFDHIRYVFGGSKKYDGRSLAEIHRHLNIKDQQFDELNMHFVKSLQEMKPKLPVFRAMAAEMQNLRPQIVFMAEEAKVGIHDPNECSADIKKVRERLGQNETPGGNVFDSTEEQRKFRVFIDQFFTRLD